MYIGTVECMAMDGKFLVTRYAHTQGNVLAEGRGKGWFRYVGRRLGRL